MALPPDAHAIWCCIRRSTEMNIHSLLGERSTYYMIEIYFAAAVVAAAAVFAIALFWEYNWMNMIIQCGTNDKVSSVRKLINNLFFCGGVFFFKLTVISFSENVHYRNASFLQCWGIILSEHVNYHPRTHSKFKEITLFNSFFHE